MIKFLMWFLVCLASTFSIVFFYYRISYSNKRVDFFVIFIFLLGVFLSTCIEYFKWETLSYISYFLYFPFLFLSLNKMSFKKLVFYIMITWFYGIAIDIFFILMLSLVCSFFNFNFYNNPDFVSMLLTVCVTVSFIFFGIVRFLAKKTEAIYQKLFDIKHYDLLLIIFACFVFCIGITMFLHLKDFDINVLLTLVILLMVITFGVLISYRINALENIKYLNTLKENNEFYMKMEDENRIFKHNLIAKLLSIKSVSNKKAMALIEDLIMQFNKSIEFSQNMKIIPYGLNGIIYQKLYPHMKELKINIDNELNYDIFDVLNPRRYNVFVEKMIIALDNAMDSCLKSDSKSLVINIYDDKSNVCIEIENSIGNDINIDLLGNKDYSTKGFKHGLGLFSAFRSNEASLNVKIINNIFVSKIIAKKTSH